MRKLQPKFDPQHLHQQAKAIKAECKAADEVAIARKEKPANEGDAAVREFYRKILLTLTESQMKALMLDTLRRTFGIVTTACDLTGIAYEKHQKWLANNPRYKKKYDLVKEMTIDMVEGGLLKNARNGSIIAQRTFLYAQATHRGWEQNKKTDTLEKYKDVTRVKIKR